MPVAISQISAHGGPRRNRPQAEAVVILAGTTPAVFIFMGVKESGYEFYPLNFRQNNIFENLYVQNLLLMGPF